MYYDFEDKTKSKLFSSNLFDETVYINEDFMFVNSHESETYSVVLTNLETKTSYNIDFFKEIGSYNLPSGEYEIKETHFTMPKSEKRNLDILNNAERKRLEQYLMYNITESNLAILLCLFTGLRIGELCGLKWSDIDFDNAIVSVRRTVQRINNCGSSEVIISSPKSKTSVRDVPIPEFLIDVLKMNKKASELFIITGTPKPTEPRTMQNRFKSILKVCGIRNVNFHLLRHTYATVCIEHGFDPKTLSEILGHADASITLNRYVHSSMQLKKNYVSRLQLTL